MSRLASALLALATAAAVAVAVAARPAVDVTATVAFGEGYTPLFGFDNILRSADDRTVSLLLDRTTGSGFISSAMYQHGFFSASIKLPSDYTAGVVVAFYTSNGDVFPKTHDELDFEFLGNIRGKPWRMQTNMYGNGSVSRGREERYVLPFDPTTEFHRYSILWARDAVVFYVDDVPVRHLRHARAGRDFPAKPMSLYATVWDASNWATSGGRYRVDYHYGPFVASFTDLALAGCRASSPTEEGCADALAASDPAVMTLAKQQAMRQFRERNMVYSYCYDTRRYPVPFPECDLVESERSRFKDSGHRLALRRRRVGRRPPNKADM
ncbi:hypothetical protein CFC21_082274 [Triticum aestivum]|uniref:Xyloglucan endotransglucosylase/hydrolase n=3 Tax=Triticum TaxID=4564 RepID=A0A3B6NJG9_WHEAT|nr:probable xyloglucan endotransglucosylase/hydrolase protein 30 [Triticum dicoccoides]XP_044406137.1 probable xyloglucan endotransglucosylase/hydrolase protein 30 [Triticum aestivum]XP_048537344.1 probable xyloglucan endotransglucosylase/hydrolase protein 30 [Triticum urartu]XP_048537367.1 probable xyloglucan endotransglucosylase/hydrolase protein 30 [Triticum urartu]KAF7077757.1 hypothetical protein CFC21_082274 [Triticum aestivum]